MEQLKSKIKRDNAEVDRLQQQVLAAPASPSQAARITALPACPAFGFPPDRVRALVPQARGVLEQIKKLEGQVGSVRPIEAVRAAAPAAVPMPDLSPAEDTQGKYEELLAKEQDLNSFLHNFQSQMNDSKVELQTKQEAVVAALERLSKAGQVVSSKALPDSGKFREMQDELEYKKIQVENAQSTQVRPAHCHCGQVAGERLSWVRGSCVRLVRLVSLRNVNGPWCRFG